jgi:hypothetical protein
MPGRLIWLAAGARAKELEMGPFILWFGSSIRAKLDPARLPLIKFPARGKLFLSLNLERQSIHYLLKLCWCNMMP